MQELVEEEEGKEQPRSALAALKVVQNTLSTSTGDFASHARALPRTTTGYLTVT